MMQTASYSGRTMATGSQMGTVVNGNDAQYVYVGPGMGDTEIFDNLTFVGEKAGTYAEVRSEGSGRLRWCSIFLCGFVVVALAGIYFAAYDSSGKKDDAPKDAIVTAANPGGKNRTIHALYNCRDGLDETWLAEKQQWCCHYEVVGCPAIAPHTKAPTLMTVDFDCKADYENWENIWSEKRREWCCTYTNRGCSTNALPYDCDLNYNEYALDWPREKSGWGCMYAQRGCTGTSAPYDCAAGFNNWERGWSGGKKEYCCAMHQRGCPWDKTYNCDEGWPLLVNSWTYKKQLWCCDNVRRGCANDVTASKPYDCLAGIVHWNIGWSENKKLWCCANEGPRGCPGNWVEPTDAPMVHVYAPEPVAQVFTYDCTHKDTTDEAERSWCCAKEPSSPMCFEHTRYECSQNVRTDDAQRSWCCAHEPASPTCNFHEPTVAPTAAPVIEQPVPQPIVVTSPPEPSTTHESWSYDYTPPVSDQKTL
mmetsp:Transcript_35348/g.56888  ORF Transcript_35348/g.56888 Transcript_35348/m.56888 type:complete len:477 (-) Transcript_35348:189-1619(-)